MTQAITKNFEYIMKVRVRIILALFATSVCFAVSYVFLMEKSTANTASLAAIQSTLAHQNQIVSDLSVQYIALSRNITLDSALAEGFVEAPVSAFITVPAPTQKSPALSINAF